MTAETSTRKRSRLDARLIRQQTIARRTALLVAALLVIALLGPFVAGYLTR